MVTRERRLWNKTEHQTQFYLSSLPCNATFISQLIRQHWGIENQAQVINNLQQIKLQKNYS